MIDLKHTIRKGTRVATTPLWIMARVRGCYRGTVLIRRGNAAIVRWDGLPDSAELVHITEICRPQSTIGQN